MKSVIILLAIGLVVRADVNRLVEREAALDKFLDQLAPRENAEGVEQNKYIIQEIRKARATSTVLGWVDAGLNGCQALSGKVATFCGITYQTPGSLVRRIVPILEPLIDTFNSNNQLTASCKNTIKEVMCKGFFPQCSGDASTATYQSLTSACNSISSCGGNAAININGVNSGSLCSDSGQTINLKSCAKYTLSSINPGVCGNLPANITFPSLSMGDLATNGALASGLSAVLLPSLVTSECRTQWQKFLCTSTPYCSPDRSRILSAVTKQQCQSALNCLPSALKTTFSASYKCESYPDQNALRVCVDPSQGFAQAAAASNLKCNRASAISIGSTLFYLACMLLAYFH